MRLGRRLRINTLNLFIIIALLLVTSGCSEEASTTDSKLTDISIPGYSGKAIVAVNTSTEQTGYSNLGTKPKTIPGLELKNQNHLKITKKDIPSAYKTSLGISLSAFDDDIETLTHLDTTHTFEAYDIPNGTGTSPVYVEATLKYGSSTSKCLIYVQNGYDSLIKAVASGTQDLETDWESLGQTFDDTIYPRLTEKFGPYYDIDSNEKVIFLFYNVDPSENDNAYANGFLAGYFWPQDIVPVDGVYTNQKDMVYMNLVTFGTTQTLQTLAHEYAHLIAYSVRRINALNDANKDLGLIDTWMNEGIAEAAAHYGLDLALDTNIEVIKTSSTIRDGEVGIFDWTGSAYQYATVYNFLQYARIQSTSGYNLFSELIQHSSGSYTSLESLLTEQNDAFETMEDIVRSYHVANVVNQESGIYGYKDERSTFSYVNLSAPSSSTSRIHPGAAVNFYPSDDDTNNFVPIGAGEHIHYYRINKDD
jgi:hypothetical protein